MPIKSKEPIFKKLHSAEADCGSEQQKFQPLKTSRNGSKQSNLLLLNVSSANLNKTKNEHHPSTVNKLAQSQYISTKKHSSMSQSNDPHKSIVSVQTLQSEVAARNRASQEKKKSGQCTPSHADNKRQPVLSTKSKSNISRNISTLKQGQLQVLSQTTEHRREDRTLPRDEASKQISEMQPRTLIESKSAKHLLSNDLNPI